MLYYSLNEVFLVYGTSVVFIVKTMLFKIADDVSSGSFKSSVIPYDLFHIGIYSLQTFEKYEAAMFSLGTGR